MFKRTSILSALLVLVPVAVAMHLGWLEVLVPKAMAQGLGAGLIGQNSLGNLGDVLSVTAQYLAQLNTFLHILLLIALDFVGYFLQSDFFTDPVMMSALNRIWQLSRDIMNVVFALMLIGVAFYTIITAKKEFIVSKITTFIIAVILVNFSWFFPRVVIDVANVLTATVYRVPNLMPGFQCRSLNNQDPPQPVECRVITAKLVFGNAGTQQTWWDANCGNNVLQGEMADDTLPVTCYCVVNFGCIKKEFYSAAIQNGTMTTSHAMVNALAVSFARIADLGQVPASIQNINPLIGQPVQNARFLAFQILMNIMMTLVVQVAVVLPLIALAVGLLMRIVIMWVAVAFMPFTFLGYVISGKLGTNVFGFEIDLWQEFINAAFIPTMVAVPFTIGFIMLSTSASIPGPAIGFLQNMDLPLLGNTRSWWAMVWMFVAIIIIWTGSFKALGKSKFIGGITDKIKGFGDTVFSGIAQLPLLTPLPLPGLRNLGQAIHLPRMTSDALRLAASGTTNQSFADIMRQRMGGATQANDTRTMLNELRSNEGRRDRVNQAIIALRAAPAADRGARIDALREQLGPQFSDRNRFSNQQLLEILRDASRNGEAPATIRDRQNDIDEILRTLRTP